MYYVGGYSVFTVDNSGANNSLKCKSNRPDYRDVGWVGKTEHIVDPFSAAESGSIWLGDWDYSIRRCK